MAYTSAELIAAYTAANNGVEPDAATRALLEAFAVQTQTGQMTDASALGYIINSAQDDVQVAVQTYQFFTGKIPTTDGLDYLTNSPTNTDDLNDGYYAQFNLENRYINFAANLGLEGEGAAAFKANYGDMSFSTFVDVVYETIIGASYAAAAGIDADAAKADIISRYDNFVQLATDRSIITSESTPEQVDLAVKASLVGYLLAEGVKADVGIYAAGANNYVNALINGTAVDDVNLLTTYSVLGGGTGSPVSDGPAGGGGQTFTLTTGPDAPVGTANDDTFVASEVTLSSADVLDGGAGIDTLRYASSGGVAVAEAGFEARNIEIVQVTSDAAGGTTFDVTGVTELQTLRNANSSEDLTLVGMDRLVGIELVNVGSAGAGATDPTPDTTLVFDAGVVAGAADSLNVVLDNNLNVDGSGVGDLTVNGVETVNVTTRGSASSLNSISSNALRGLVISGDQNLTLANANFVNTLAPNTVNASALTGNLNLTLTNDNVAGIAVGVTGGSGNDVVAFQAFNTGDSFNGGDGVDTIALTNAIAVARTPANGGTLTNVEQLNVTTAGTGAINMDAFAGVAKVIYDAGLTNGATSSVVNAVSGITVEVDTLAAGTGNLTVDLKVDGAADVVTIELDGIAAGHAVGTINVDDAETLNISADDDTPTGNGAVTIGNLVLTDTRTLNLSGDADITLAAATNPGVPVLNVVNAGTVTGNLSITGLNTAASGATITLGAGADVFNVATSNGADVITLGLGADRIVYTAVPQSDSDMDRITDFVSGTDIVDVRALLGGALASSNQFVGNFATFAQAQGALVGGLAFSAVFQQDEKILWVDADGNGTLDNNDFRVQLDNVTSLTARDLGFVPGVTFTANKVGFNTATAADSVENNAVGAENDVINATVAQLVGATVNGQGGANVINISGTAAPGEVADLTGATNVQTVNLAASVEGVAMGVANLGGLQTTRIAGQGGTIQSLNIGNGSDISGVVLSNIEVLNMADVVTMTAAQHNAFQQINAAGGSDQITLTTAGTIVADDDIETYSIVEGSTLTVGTSAAGLARKVTETGTVGTVSTLILGNGAYTGTYTGFESTDVVRVGTTTSLSGATGLNAVTVDFQNAASAGAGLTLSAAQNGNVTFANTGGTQTVTVDAVDVFTVADGIENYALVGGSTVTVSATNTAVNITADNAGASTVNIGGNTVTGAYNLQHAADVLVATDGANITGVNVGAATTAETLTLTGNITLTNGQYAAFTTITAAGGADSVTLTDAGAVAANAAVESYVLNAAGADTITFDESADPTLTDALRDGMSVNLAGGGIDTVVINNAAVNDGANSSITITNFGADDVISTAVGATSTSNGIFTNNYNGAAPLAVGAGGVVEIDATAYQAGVPTNTAAVLAWLSGNVTAGAANVIATVIAYNGAGQAAIYHVEETTGAAGAFDTIELIGIVNAADNSLVGANFA